MKDSSVRHQWIALTSHLKWGIAYQEIETRHERPKICEYLEAFKYLDIRYSSAIN